MCGFEVRAVPVGGEGHFRWTCRGCGRDYCYDTDAPCFGEVWEAVSRRKRVLHGGAPYGPGEPWGAGC